MINHKLSSNMFILLIYSSLLFNFNLNLIKCEQYSQSNENITILHEVSNDPLDLNTHEILPSKTVKKKPYAILEKPSDIDKHRLLKDFGGTHAVPFDFNLDDLEDVHETVNKNEEYDLDEQVLLRDVDKYTSNNFNISTISTTNSEPFTGKVTTITATTPSAASPTATTEVLERFEYKTNFNGSPHIFKVIKSKSKIKGREMLKKEELQKTLGNQYNSVNRFLIENDNYTADNYNVNGNVYQVIVNLFDHFYWQPSEIRQRVSAVCGVEVLAYLSALNNNYEWAQKVYDSSGHFRGQFLFGNNKWMGQRPFCNEVNTQNEAKAQRHFDFQFFAAIVDLKAWIPMKVTTVLQIGECLPKSCTTKDIQAILELDPHARMLTSFNSTPETTKIQILNVRKVPGDYCLWKDARFKIFISITSTIVILSLIATWYEYKVKITERDKQRIAIVEDTLKIDRTKVINDSINGKSFELYQINGTENNNVNVEIDLNNIKINENGNGKIKDDLNATQNGIHSNGGQHLNVSITGHTTKLNIPEKLLLCFAIPSNVKAILSLEKSKSETISCVHGLRVLAVLWTILVHSYLQVFNVAENRFKRIFTERSFFYQFVGNATFSVDTFFFISGLLMTLIFFRQQKKKSSSSLTAQEFVQKGFIESGISIFYRYIRLTPVYLFVIGFNEFSLRHTFNQSVFNPTVPYDTCNDYWWRNILYINNFYPLNEICMIWSWYMANDMQFYIMAIILLILSKRYFKVAFITLTTFLVTSWTISGIISIKHNYIHKVAEPFESFDFLYDKPWQRVGTYIVGMTVGYCIYKVKTPPKIPFGLNLALWTGSLGLLFIIIFGVWKGQLGILATAFYVSIGHTAFGVGLIWIVLSCAWGYSDSINKILSYRGWLPLSRLTYCTYLIHPVIMLITSFNMDGTLQLDHMIIFTIFYGNAVLSFMAAFIISVLFESPVIRMLKILIKK